jgi:protein gp37
MADRTKISYADATWSPYVGCEPISTGCLNCFAARFAGTRLAKLDAYKGLAEPRSGGGWQFNGQVQVNERHFYDPAKWLRARRILVPSMGDLFHLDSYTDIEAAFEVMVSAPQHTYLVLTKRPNLMCTFMMEHPEYVLPNIWHGTTVNCQDEVPRRLGWLRRTPSAHRWLSAEPLLEELDLSGYLGHLAVEWVVCGMEQGPGKRSVGGYQVSGQLAQVRYADKERSAAACRSIRDQCRWAGVPFWFKANSEGLPYLQGRICHQMPTDWGVASDDGLGFEGQVAAGV